MKIEAVLVSMLYFSDGSFIDGNSYPGFEPVVIGSFVECRQRRDFLNETPIKPPEGVLRIRFSCKDQPLGWRP